MSKKIRVGLVFGGRSGEHEVSIASALSVYKALDKMRYDVTLIAIDKTGRWLTLEPQSLIDVGDNPSRLSLHNFDDEDLAIVPHPGLHQLVSSKIGQTSIGVPNVDVVLPIIHGTFGEDGTLQGLFELAQIAYAGSGVLGSALGMDKEMAGKLFELAGIKTVPTISVRKHQYEAAPADWRAKISKEFGFPVFIKPANAGSSVGVHKVKSAQELDVAFLDAFTFDLKVLVQKAIDARELEVSVLGNNEPQASVVGEIIPRHEFYSYEAKYIDEKGAELHIPAKSLTKDIENLAKNWAIAAFKALECRGMARVDFFLDRQSGQLYINEINTIPGFTSISMYPKLWEASGLSYPELLDELIRLALDFHAQRQKLKTNYRST